MTQDDLAKAMKKLLTRLRKEHPAPEAGSGEPAAVPVAAEGGDACVQALIHAFMLWEASADLASAAMARLSSELVDANELRVCLVHEAVTLIGGDAYPRARERCELLRRALNAIFEAEHALTLDHLAEMPKRAVRAYLEALPGMPPFVAARVALLHADAHAFPLDDRLAARLAAAGIASDEPADKLASRIERSLRAGEALEAYLLVERLDAAAARAKPARKASKAAPARKASAGPAAGRKRPSAKGGA